LNPFSRQSKPAITDLTAETTDAFSSSDLVVIIGTFTDQNSADFKAFEATANALRDSYSFGWNVGTETKIVLYKKFDDGKADFTGAVTKESLTQFIETESIPLVGEIGPDNYAQYVNRDLPIAYFFYETAAHKETTGKSALEPLAKIFKGKVSVVYIDAVKFGSHGQSMNLPTTWPGFVISYPKLNTKFPFVGELTFERLKAHTQAVVDDA
jgi:protein disulfide-isomerase A1